MTVPSARRRARVRCACAAGVAVAVAVGLALLADAAVAQAPEAAAPPLEAAAPSLEAAESAYAEGRFLAAAEIGAALGTSEGYVVATRSLAVYAHYEASDEEYGEVAARAMRLGDEAVRADSSSADAHCYAASAAGRYVQRVGPVEAVRRGLAGKIRSLLETALALDPDHVMAIVALGGWHADVSANGRMARMLYGGSPDEAVALFERALALAPESKVVLYQYAARLPRLDRDGGAQRARAMLERAIGLPVRDVHENYVHLDVLDALDALNEGPTPPRAPETRR